MYEGEVVYGEEMVEDYEYCVEEVIHKLEKKGVIYGE